jgi:hypothetical protein
MCRFCTQNNEEWPELIHQDPRAFNQSKPTVGRAQFCPSPFIRQPPPAKAQITLGPTSNPVVSQLKCHKCREFLLATNPYGKDGWTCDVCKSQHPNIHDVPFHCPACEFDLCRVCGEEELWAFSG